MKKAFSSAEIAKLDRALGRIQGKVMYAVATGVLDGAERIMEDSEQRVPVMTGTLKSSMEKQFEYHGERNESGCSAVVMYGGNGDPVNPETHARASKYMLKPGKNKDNWHGTYLYRAFDKEKDGIVDDIKAKLKEVK